MFDSKIHIFYDFSVNFSPPDAVQGGMDGMQLKICLHFPSSILILLYFLKQ